MQNLISVIMPAYNVSNYIEKSIQSVQQQKKMDWELIVIDDGSTDRTRSIVQRMAKFDRRIKYVYQDNQGVASARNTGIRHACGEFISFLDGDDLWDPDFLCELSVVQKEHNVSLVYCGFEEFLDQEILQNYKYRYVNGNALLAYINRITWLHIGAILVEKRVLYERGIRFTKGCRMGEDQEFLLKLLCNCPVESVPRPMLKYRKRPDSATKLPWQYETYLDVVDAYGRAHAYIAKNCLNNLFAEVACRALQRQIATVLLDILWKMILAIKHNELEQLMTTERYLSNIKWALP